MASWSASASATIRAVFARRRARSSDSSVRRWRSARSSFARPSSVVAVDDDEEDDDEEDALAEEGAAAPSEEDMGERGPYGRSGGEGEKARLKKTNSRALRKESGREVF